MEYLVATSGIGQFVCVSTMCLLHKSSSCAFILLVQRYYFYNHVRSVSPSRCISRRKIS